MFCFKKSGRHRSLSSILSHSLPFSPILSHSLPFSPILSIHEDAPKTPEHQARREWRECASPQIRRCATAIPSCVPHWTTCVRTSRVQPGVHLRRAFEPTYGVERLVVEIEEIAHCFIRSAVSQRSVGFSIALRVDACTWSTRYMRTQCWHRLGLGRRA